jgi:hypothetical protein
MSLKPNYTISPSQLGFIKNFIDGCLKTGTFTNANQKEGARQALSILANVEEKVIYADSAESTTGTNR